MRVLQALLFFSASLIANQCLASCLLGPNHFDNIIVLFDKLSETTHFESVSYFEGGELVKVGTITQMESTTQVKLFKLSAEKAHDQIHIFTADLSEKTFGFYQFIDGIRHDPEPVVGKFNVDSCSIRFEKEDLATLDIEVAESGVLVSVRDRVSTDEPHKVSFTVHYRIGDGKS